MNGYNKSILMGTVGADAEVKTLEGGMTVAHMSIAVNEVYTDKAGVRQQKTDWFRIEGWKNTANFMGQYCKKGTTVLIDGKLKNESYEQDGVTKYSQKVIANSINFAGSKSTGTAAPTAPTTAAPAPAAPVAAAPAAPAIAAPAVTQEQFVDGMQNGAADDLPF